MGEWEVGGADIVDLDGDEVEIEIMENLRNGSWIWSS